jgi:NADH-quinone oxidoreductase subunit J
MLLIIVYVGAIATLFLFVVMMADSKPRSISKTKSFLQLSLILLVLFVLNIVFYIKKPVINFSSHLIVQNNFTVYNTTLFSIGDELYTKYAFLFEICGFILFATMIGVIYMVKHYGFLNSETKRTQSVSAQVLKNAKDCVELIKDVKSGYGID